MIEYLKTDNGLEFCNTEFNNICILLDVNDILLIGSALKWTSNIKTNLNGEIDKKNLGKAKKILDIKIERDMSNPI